MTAGAIKGSGLMRKKAADIAMTYATGGWGMAMDTGGRSVPTHDEIAQRAFSLYESRGRQDGHDVDDWLQAEQELVRHYA